ncbi:MAG: hypothetical protein A2X49_13085 [Lentisphaerae bacterium GWF2_52_8]|nr:MAG: hypothetical protein A2X49_13085 [Lentisphaerae bacterium GWF2_52_8]
MTRNSDIGTRSVVVMLFFFLCLIFLGVRLYQVQINRHDELYAKAKEKYTAIAVKSGSRGEIYDSKGNLLIGNIPCADIVADPQIVGDEFKCRKIANLIASELHLDEAKIYERLMMKTRIVTAKDGSQSASTVRYVVLADKVDFADAERLREEVSKAKYKGVYFNECTKRFYPKNELLANILGFTNLDRDKVVAVFGVEKYFDKNISPTKVKNLYVRDRLGRPLTYGDSRINEVRDGLNIYLTIQEPIQAILEEELDKLVEKWKPRAAYAILADPYSGDILAVAQRPTYNPNERSVMNPEAWRNRIAEDTFDPGSTMKPFAISGALDYGIVTPSTKFDCEKGRWFYGGKILRDSHPLGTLSVSEIIQKSSNIGTAKIALLMGEKRLNDTLRSFGFGSRTGVPLSPETSGLFRPLEKWDNLSITRFPIGQGIAVSPLQLVRAYCVLANGGYSLNLNLVDRVENPDTGEVMQVKRGPGPSIFKNPETQHKIVEMMKLVTQQGGTAEKAAIKGYYVGGKTGTSQKCLNGHYSESQFFATFVGFVPADKPSFVLLVTADEPKGNHFGGIVAAPAFSSIGYRVLRYMNVRPNAFEEMAKK